MEDKSTKTPDPFVFPFYFLKNELVHDQDFLTREEAQAAVFEFIEVFYNRQRLHQTLGYVTPVQFEAAHVP